MQTLVDYGRLGDAALASDTNSHLDRRAAAGEQFTEDHAPMLDLVEQIHGLSKQAVDAMHTLYDADAASRYLDAILDKLACRDS